MLICSFMGVANFFFICDIIDIQHYMVMLTFITGLRWCLPGFSSVKLIRTLYLQINNKYFAMRYFQTFTH